MYLYFKVYQFFSSFLLILSRRLFTVHREDEDGKLQIEYKSKIFYIYAYPINLSNISMPIHLSIYLGRVHRAAEGGQGQRRPQAGLRDSPRPSILLHYNNIHIFIDIHSFL